MDATYRRRLEISIHSEELHNFKAGIQYSLNSFLRCCSFLSLCKINDFLQGGTFLSLITLKATSAGMKGRSASNNRMVSNVRAGNTDHLAFEKCNTQRNQIQALMCSKCYHCQLKLRVATTTAIATKSPITAASKNKEQIGVTECYNC